MKAKLLGAVAALALMAGASSAQVAIVDITYTGVVTYNIDQTGIFGPAGGDNNLVGSTLQITYRFDTTKGNTSSSATQNFAIGGSSYGVASPSLGATATVGALTGPAIAGSNEGFIYGGNDPSVPFAQQFHLANDYTNTGGVETGAFAQSSVYNNTPGTSLPATIDMPFTYTVQPEEVHYMEVGYYVYDDNIGAEPVDTYLEGEVTSITETLEGAPSPTPGSGLLGLAALLLAGSFPRARRA
jgi:hypothetical protein